MKTVQEQISTDFVTVMGKSYHRIQHTVTSVLQGHTVTAWGSQRYVAPVTRQWKTLTWYETTKYPTLSDAINAWYRNR